MEWVAPSGGNVAFVQHAFADINGDGRQDLFMVELTSANNYSATYALQNDDGSYDKQGSSWAINKEKDSDSRNFRISPIDINVDGRMDIALYIPGLKKWQLYLAEPTTTGTWRLSKTEFNFPSNSKDLAFADLNSDAVTDAYLAAKDGLKVYKLERQPDSSESSMAYSFDTVGESLNSTAQLDGKTIAFGDINGDGALDYIGVSRSMKNDNSYGDEEEGDILECDVRESLVVGLSVPGASDVEWNVVESVSEAGKIYSDQGMSCSTLASFTHATIGNIIVLDLNGDGVSDLLYAQKSLAGSATNIDGQVTYSSAYYRLGKGDGTFTDKTKFNNGVFKNFGLMDYDYDGKPDVYIRQKTENIELSKWNGLGFDVTANTIHTDVDSNSSIQYFDYTGDGSTDRITVEGDRIRYAQGRKEYARHKIYKINSGFGVATEVSYEPLSLTESYARVEGISVESINYEREYSPAPGVTVYVPAVKNVVDPTKFYGALNEPFTDVTTSNVALYKKVPVLEFMAPISVVTLVESSSPSYSTTTKKVEPTKAGVAYMYGEAKIQAGGRGFLGYKTLRTVDLQTLIETTTTYRQDWPFVGTPLKTVVKTPEGHRLSESETESRALLTDFTTTGIENRGDNDEPDADETNNYAVNIGAEHITDAMENGSGVLGPVQIFTYKQASKSFAFAEGQTSEGGLLKTSEVVTSLIDHYGNVKTVSTRHLDGSNVEQSAQTVNSYYFSTEALPLDIARLKRTVAVNSRPNTAEKRRTALFDYYGGGCVSSQHTGMLCSESVEVNDVAGTVTTTHYYDAFGNEVFNRQEADGQTRLSSLSVYGSDGRYPIKTYGVFSSEAGASVSTENGEYNGAINGSGSIQLTSEIVLRDKHGIPLQSHSYIGNGNYVTNRIAVTPFGNTILKSSSTGAYETFLGDFNVGACPSGSGAFYTISSSSAGGAKSGACFDILGRKVSTYKVGFSGTRTQTAVRYDILSRTIATSEPFIGVSTNYWTDIQYDTVGRVTETQHPFDTVTRTTTKDAPSALGGSSGERAVSLVSYNGLSTTFTNAENQTKTEVKNILGEITSVTEGGAGGRTAHYEYDANGKLQKVLSEGVQITEIVYDGMGRKISMDDDDKGQWSYQYNGFGNLTCQEDGENNVIYNQYDIRGRLVARTDYINASCTNRSTDNITAQASWMYDKASNGLGKLASEQDTKSRYAKTYSYDNFGRISAGMDQFPGADGELSQHHQKVTYDQYGRTYQNFDAARVSNEFNTNGTQNVYNTYGYLSKVVNAANTSEKYYEVIGMNARGQVTTHTLGAAVRVNSSYKAESGLLASINSNSLVNNATLQNLSLKWDHLGNLLYRNESTFGSGWERYEYNGYNELANTYFVNGGSETSQSVTYDNFGNIKSKTGMGNYTYDPVKLHAVTSTANHSYRYDNNGNMLAETNTLYGEVEREFTYSAFNKATQVKVYDVLQGDETLKAQVNFSYGTGRNRFKRVDTNHENGKQTTTLYAGGVEKVYYADGTIEWKRNIAGVGQITQKVTTTGALVSEQKQYFLKDHLGSISVIMSDTAEVLQKMAFDPWGARRDLNSIESMTTGNVLAYYAKEAKPITSRGFTGHEMVDAVGIIHMNGRIYDAKLGRFLQADPFVQEPTMVGSLNRYSYIMNNPLNGVDPSGFNWVSDRWHASKDDIKPYAGLIVGTLLVIATGGASAAAFAAEKASWFVSSWYGAAALGGISGAVGSGVNGGNVMKGALFGAVSGAAFYGVGSMFADGGSLAGLQSGIKELVQGGMHGVTGGILADLQGGQFGHGFVSAGIAKGVSLGAVALTNSVSVQFVAAALAGGTASKMTGGKFANGAQSAAIAFVANHIQGLKRSVAQKGLDRHEGKEGYSHLESLDDITFENDVPGGPHTDRAIDTDLVNALHTSLDNSGLTVNVNSTTGGHGVGTPHYNGKAIDINQVGGVKVQFLTDNGLMRDVLILQRNLMMQPGVIKVFGPVYNYVKHNGNWIQANSHVSLRQSHSNHIHVQVE
jgi:RHS repeat-associated core domain